MKKLLLVAVLVLVAASFVMAQTLPTMANGKHDFRYSKATGIKGASEKLCSYCHTPHVPATGIKTPLWSRAKLASAGYGIYDNTTMDANPTALAVGDINNSSLCMSCHDGSLLFASAAYVKRPHAGTVAWTTYMTDTAKVGDAANLHTGTKYGTGLSHTHPVNFTYADGGAGIQLPTPRAIDANVAPPLYDGMMQCGSCHDPHLSSKMTRVSTDNGSLCISCHLK